MILLGLCFISLVAFADVDPFNALLWNRENALAANGQVDRSPWFEWWYYKVLDPATGHAFFFTYGVINPWDSTDTLGGTKSVVEAGEFTNHLLLNDSMPVTSFKASYDKTFVQIGENTATDQALVGHVVKDGHDMAWNLSLVKNWGFDAMGWTMKTGSMSGIYWYPAQASATVNGWIRIDGQTYNLVNAPGYQDRNWGNGFPKWWTWLVSNEFKNSPGTTLAVGGGEPELLGSVYLFSGLCIGLNYQGKEYVFRTTDGNDVQFDIHWGKWNVTAQNSTTRLEISAYAPPEKFMMLPFMSPQGATFYDYEALTGQMTVRLLTRATIFSDWTLMDTLETDSAGIEWGTPQPLSLSGVFNSASIFTK